MEILEHLKRLEAKATKAPWKFVSRANGNYRILADIGTGRPDPLVESHGHPSPEMDAEDAEFVAAMRNTLPVLIELAEDVEEFLKDMEIGDYLPQNMQSTLKKLRELSDGNT